MAARPSPPPSQLPTQPEIRIRLKPVTNIGDELDELRDKIERRAYERFVRRGCESGKDWEDWFTAEEELDLPAKVQESIASVLVSVSLKHFAFSKVDVLIASQDLFIKGIEEGQNSSQGVRSRSKGIHIKNKLDVNSVTAELLEDVLHIHVSHPGQSAPWATTEVESSDTLTCFPKIFSPGFVLGWLRAVQEEHDSLWFIQPVKGDQVACVFRDGLMDDMKGGLGKYVKVTGTLSFRKKESLPYKIAVESIEVYPSEDQMPTLESLRGIAPHLTGDLDSVDFVRKLRNAK